MTKSAEQLLSPECPVCGSPMKAIGYERLLVKGVARRVGISIEPIDVVDVEYLEKAVFNCGMVRERATAKGKWGSWKYDEERQCSNAQDVVLGLRGM